MKRLIFILLFLLSCYYPLEARCRVRPCIERYYNPVWAGNDLWYYGYTEMNDYPYALPVNYCFNPRPCPSRQQCIDYRYLIWCLQNEQPEVCPQCNGIHFSNK